MVERLILNSDSIPVLVKQIEISPQPKPDVGPPERLSRQTRAFDGPIRFTSCIPHRIPNARRDQYVVAGRRHMVSVAPRLREAQIIVVWRAIPDWYTDDFPTGYVRVREVAVREHDADRHLVQSVRIA